MVYIVILVNRSWALEFARPWAKAIAIGLCKNSKVAKPKEHFYLKASLKYQISI